MTPSRGLRRIFSAALAAAMTCSWTLPSLAQSVADEATRAVEYTSQLERSLMAIEDGRRQLPRDRWDPQYVVDTVGIDPEALFAFVRDEIAWIPYRGTLRGPMGTLLDRQANTLDSSLLLADLMTRAGYRTRLAHAELPPEAVDALWAYFAENAATPVAPVEAGAAAPETGAGEDVAQPAADVALPAEAVAEAAPAEPPAADGSGSLFGDPGSTSGSLFEAAPVAETVAASPDEVAELYELDKDTAGKKLSEVAANRDSLASELDRRTINQGVRLLEMFAASEDGAQQAYEQARAQEALADHWWVQVEDNGAWTDYDSLGPSGEPGATWTVAEETLERDSLPAELTHRVRLRVVAEQLLDGKLVENAVLEHEVVASEVIGKPISLRHLPLLWPSEWAAVTPDDVQEKLFAALVTQNEWMPALTIGQDAFQQASVLDTGAVNPDPQPKSNPFLQISFPAAGKVARVADLFDQLLEESAELGGDAVADQPSGDKPRADGELTAEWLEYTLLVPGEEPKVTRRDVFDIVGPAVRMGGDLSGFRLDEDKRLARAGGQMTETEIVILPAWPAAEYLADMTAELALANRPLLAEFTRDPFGKAPPNSIELFSKMTGMPAAAYLYSTLRSDVSATRGFVFIDRPQIVAQHGVLTRVGPGEMTAKAALDVIENGVGVDPFVADQFVIRVLQGVADTNAEALALGKGGENVGEAFEKALDEPEWTVFFPDDADLIGTLGLAPDVLARLLGDLNAGYAIVSPTGDAKPFELVGWWRVDPLTGTTLGMGNNGWGTTIVEYAFVVVIKVMLAQIACMAYTAAAEEKVRGLTAEQGREKVKAWAKSCVSQALLETVAGLGTAWIEGLILRGKLLPFSIRGRDGWPSGSRIGPKGGRPMSVGGGAKGNPLGAKGNPLGAKGNPLGAKGNPLGAKGNPLGAKGNPLGAKGDPFGAKGNPLGGGLKGKPLGAQPDRPVAGNRQDDLPCRADAGFVRFAALSQGESPIRRDFEEANPWLIATGAGCGPNKNRGRTERLDGVGGHVDPKPERYPEAVQAAKQQTDDYLAAKQKEVDAAKRYHAEPTYENRDAYKAAYDAAQAAHMREINAYNNAGGRGHPPGTFTAPKIPPAPAGWEPLPPRAGEPNPSGPPVKRIEPIGGQPEKQRTEPMRDAPPHPTGKDPAQEAARVDAIRSQTDARIAAQQREAAAERAFDANPNDPAARRDLEQALDAANKAHMAELEAWARAGGRGHPPTKGAVPSSGSNPAPTAAPQAGTTPTGPNNTLAMGLGALAGAVQKGP